MKKYIVKIILTFSLFILICRCNKESDPLSGENTNEEIKNSTKIEYTFISNAPSYKQSSILCKYNSNLYRFGTHLPLQIFNLDTKTWSSIPLPDPSFGRWDGTAVIIGSNIYLIAHATQTYTSDIVKYSINSKSYEHTGIQLPDDFEYPAVCKYTERIIFLTTASDSVFNYNTSNNKLTKIAGNPFYQSDFYTRDASTFSFGIYKNYFYVFCSKAQTSSLTNYYNHFYRLNLSNNSWEEIYTPLELRSVKIFGSSAGNKMYLFNDSSSAYTFSYDRMDWAMDNSVNPIKDFAIGEWSFTPDDSCFYGSDVWTKAIWKISIQK